MEREYSPQTGLKGYIMKLLLIEDDREISAMLRDFLTAEGYAVDTAPDGEEACRLFDAGRYNLVLLDLMIPKRSGIEVMRQIRRTSTVPILILSARDSDSDKTLGLGLGADDYITKPFSVSEVLARIKANLRRANQYAAAAPSAPSVLRAGTLVLDTGDHSVTKSGILVELTAKEFEILRQLMLHPQTVYTKAQLYALVWNDAYLGDENAVNVHISRLRAKIEDDPRQPEYIMTVWGIGYRLGDCHA